jgi:hypothetical protein
MKNFHGNIKHGFPIPNLNHQELCPIPTLLININEEFPWEHKEWILNQIATGKSNQRT